MFKAIGDFIKRLFTKIIRLIFMSDLEGNMFALTIVRIISILCVLAFVSFFSVGLGVYNSDRNHSYEGSGLGMIFGFFIMLSSFIFLGVQALVRLLSRRSFNKKEDFEIES